MRKGTWRPILPMTGAFIRVHSPNPVSPYKLLVHTSYVATTSRSHTTPSLLLSAVTVPYVIDAGSDLKFVSSAVAPVSNAPNNISSPELDHSIPTRNAVPHLHGQLRRRSPT